MPFNKDKTITLRELLSRVKARIEASGSRQVLSFFTSFVEQGLSHTLVEVGYQSDVADIDLNAGDFDAFYRVAVEILCQAAGRNFSEVHPDTYQDAHGVSEAFCAELNEYFECSGEDGLFDLIPVKSHLEMVTGVNPAARA